MNTYREEQLQKINMMADAMKLVSPQKSAGPAN
jgi:hypothetical protein